MSDLASRWEATFQSNYGTPALELDHGRGAAVWDAEGREYLDLIAGIAVSSLGHGHPAIVGAIAAQAAKIAHTSNLYANGPALALGEKLQELVGEPSARVLLCNSGAEAVEAALKLARRRSYDLGAERTRVIACHGAFHGRTGFALSVTGQPKKRAPFEPLPGPVTFVDFGDAAALEAAMGQDVAAVILEPTMGESGVVVPPPGYLAAAREVCDRFGALLILDEVQGAIGRTGEWFAHRHPLLGPVKPDVITLAKGLAGGLPIGAMIAMGEAATALKPGDHGTTFGGNPVSAAAALAVIETIEADGLLSHAATTGAHLLGRLVEISHPLVAEVRGLGLWIGIVLTQPVAVELEQQSRAAGFLVNAAVPDVVRLAPPLVITTKQVDRYVDELPHLLQTVLGRVSGA